MKGKTTHTQTTRLVTDYVEIPPSVLEKNKHVTLIIDIMYVNRILFVTKSVTILHLPLLRPYKTEQKLN